MDRENLLAKFNATIGLYDLTPASALPRYVTLFSNMGINIIMIIMNYSNFLAFNHELVKCWDCMFYQEQICGGD